MTKFRQHRGTLADSLKTTIELRDRQHLLEWLASYFDEVWPGAPATLDPAAVHVRPHTFDPRINWDTHMVIVDGWGPVGFTNGPL